MSTHRRDSQPCDISRREFLVMGGAAAAGLILAGCSPAPTPVPPTATSAPKPTAIPPTVAPAAVATSAPPVAAASPVPARAALKANLAKVSVGYDNPNWSHHAADIVARDKGWFKEFGITDVPDIIFDNSMTAVVGGGVDWSATDTELALVANVTKGVDIWWLGTRRDHEDLLFGLAPGVTVEMLKGSKAPMSGGPVGSRNELLGKKMLRELGIDPEKDVTWITVGGGSDTRVVALQNKSLWGTTLQTRHRQMLKDMKGTMVYDKQRIIAQDGYVVMGPYMKKNPETITAYLAGLIKAKLYMKDLKTKDEVIAILEKAGFKFSQDFRDAYESNILNMSADGGFEISEMQLVWDELSAVVPPVVPANFEWRKGVNLEFLWKAQEYNGLKRRPANL